MDTQPNCSDEPTQTTCRGDRPPLPGFAFVSNALERSASANHRVSIAFRNEADRAVRDASGVRSDVRARFVGDAPAPVAAGASSR